MPRTSRTCKGVKIAVLILQAPTTPFDDLATLIPEVLKAFEAIKPGEVIRIGRR